MFWIPCGLLGVEGITRSCGSMVQLQGFNTLSAYLSSKIPQKTAEDHPKYCNTEVEEHTYPGVVQTSRHCSKKEPYGP